MGQLDGIVIPVVAFAPAVEDAEDDGARSFR
jgi:hypothetical protein